MTRIVSICLLIVLAAAGSGAQTPEPADGAARLRDFEATYQAGLRKIQSPLLNDYALKLQQLAATASVTDQPAIRAELDRVKSLIAAGGLVDLRPAAASPMQGATATAAPRPMAPQAAVLVLKPDTAQGPAVSGSAITLGKAEWPVAHLDAGSYDFAAICSFSPFTGAASITTSLHGQEVTEQLKPQKAARAPDQFSFLRLGRLRFDSEVRNENLKIELKSTDLSGVQIRQVIISRPRGGG